MEERNWVGSVFGLSREQIVALFGQPDTVSATSRRHPNPQVFKYGSVELYFGRERDAQCCSLFVEPPVVGTAAWPCPRLGLLWGLAQMTPIERMEGLLTRHSIAYTEVADTTGAVLRLIGSGVSLHFGETGELEGIYVGR